MPCAIRHYKGSLCQCKGSLCQYKGSRRALYLCEKKTVHKHVLAPPSAISVPQPHALAVPHELGERGRDHLQGRQLRAPIRGPEEADRDLESGHA
eukprot:3733261-Rhodomonas_salina.1